MYCSLGISFALGYILGMLQNLDSCPIPYYISRCVNSSFPIIQDKIHTELLIIVFSAPSNNIQRTTIRNTWLSAKGQHSFQHYFVIGTASLGSDSKKELDTENALHKDLMLLPAVSDSYSRLSLKLIAALKWSNLHANYTYLLKVDDDTFVHLDALFKLLSLQPSKRLYLGFFDGRAKVKTKGKWIEDSWFLCDTYLPYAKGGGYVLSSDLVKFITGNADFLTLYKNEDVSLGTWLAPLNVIRVHDTRFDTEFRSRGCANTYVVMHKQTVAMMVKKHQNLIASGKICPVEHLSRYSYIYNWKVPPSLCCIRNISDV